MNEFYHAKFNELFVEFTRYLVEHPEFAERIPDGTEVMLLDSRDPAYNRYILSTVQAAATEHFVVYIEVGDLRPIRSRLQNPRVIQSPATYISI